MPGELLAERGVVVGLDALNGEGQILADLLEKLSRRTSVVVIVDAQHAKARSLVNGRELVIALVSATDSRDKLYIELNGSPWNFQRAFRQRLRARMVTLERDSADIVAAEDLQDSDPGNRDLLMALQIQAHSHRTVTPLLAQAKNQSDHFWRNPIGDSFRSAGPVPQTLFALSLKASPPDIELITRNPEEPAGQADVVADLLAVLKHSKPHLGFAGLLLLGDHAEPPG
jgi:hypothetical protein